MLLVLNDGVKKGISIENENSSGMDDLLHALIEKRGIKDHHGKAHQSKRGKPKKDLFTSLYKKHNHIV